MSGWIAAADALDVSAGFYPNAETLIAAIAPGWKAGTGARAQDRQTRVLYERAVEVTDTAKTRILHGSEKAISRLPAEIAAMLRADAKASLPNIDWDATWPPLVTVVPVLRDDVSPRILQVAYGNRGQFIESLVRLKILSLIPIADAVG